MKQVSVPYCTNCKSLCIRFTQSMVRYGVATMEVIDEGYPEEVDYEWNDSESFDSYCPNCGGVLIEEDDVQLDQELFNKIKKELLANNKDTLHIEINLGENESISDIPAEKIREIIFEGLV